MKLLLAVAFGCLSMALLVTSQWPWMLFGFFGLVPWLVVLGQTDKTRAALLAGCLMSLAYVAGVGYWIPSMITAFTGMPWLLSLLITVVFAPLIQPQFVAYALARHWVGNYRAWGWLAAAPLAAGFAFVATDWAFPKVFSDTLGDNLLGAVWLRQNADLVGSLGLGFLILMINEALLALIRAWQNARPRRQWKPLLIPVSVLAGLLIVPNGYGAWRYQQLNQPIPQATRLNYVMVQAGFSHFSMMARQYGGYLTVRTVLDTHVALSREGMAQQPADLVIWPENVYPLSFGTPQDAEAERLDDRIRELVQRTGTPLLFGARDQANDDWFNGAFLLQPDNGQAPPLQTYRKASLFPFVEYTPRWLPLQADWLGTFTPGPGPELFTLDLADQRSLSVLPLICYDALFPDHVIRGVRQGAEVLLTLSNDSWFEYGNTPQIILHGSAFRSIETRRPQLRTTVTGVSAVITPAGDIIDRLETGEYGVLVGSIQPASGNTLILRLGNWFGPASVLGLIVLLGASRLRRHSARR